MNTYVLRLCILPVLLALLACSRPAPPDLVLISLDTVRADSFVEATKLSPVLAGLRASSVEFQSAATPTPLTLPAHSSLLSGLDPNQHGVRNNGQVLASEIPLLAERLQDMGYRTSAVVSAFPLDRQFGLARGFTQYDQPVAPANQSSGFSTLERNAAQSIDVALQQLPAIPPVEPQLLWLHLFDAHAPYAAPGSDPSQTLRQRYLDEIVYMGEQLGRLLQRLEQRDRPFVLVLVADHGEGLGDHGELDHGLLLFDSTVLVPMLWYAPGRLAPRQIAQTARLVDVMPTLLAIAGAAAPETLDGINLWPLLEGAEQLIPPAYAESYYARYAYQHAPLRSLRDGRWKLIGSEEDFELFDLHTDPVELRNVAQEHGPVVDRMSFDAWQRAEPAAPAGVDPATLQRLASLGYLSAPTGSSASDSEPHPRAVVDSHRRLIELQSLLSEGKDQDALQAAVLLHQDEPRNSFAAYVLGVLQLDSGDATTAAVTLNAAVELDPGNSQTRFKLADALMRSGQPALALPQWQALEILEPQRVAVWTNKAAALAALGEWSQAWPAISQALSLDPQDVVALDNAIAIAERLGHWSAAADLYQRLAQKSGFSRRGHLALALLRANRLAEAQAFSSAAQASDPQYGALLIVQAVTALRQQRQSEATTALSTLATQYPQLLQRAAREFAELRELQSN